MSALRKSSTLLCGAAALCVVAVPALAQQNSSTGLEEIVVTAQRRAVDLQKTPIAISALSGAQLDNSTIQSTMDLQYRTPGFVFKTNTVLGQPYIRGVGSDIISAGADASVATFVDDVYQSRASASIQDFYDLDRIEVVKGPQSTLYGRNVTGGAIRLFSKRPQPEFGASADVLYGNYDKIRVRGMLNAPLVSDRLIVRLSGLSSDRDGYTKNIVSGQTLDDENVWSVRGQMLFKASEAVELLLIADYTKEDSSRSLGNYPDTTCCVNLGILFGGIVPSDPREVTHDVADAAHSLAKGLSAKLTWDTGAVTLTSISAYRKSSFEEALDLDSTNIPAVANFPREQSKTFTQDLQLASNGFGPLEWVGGLFYLTEDAFQALDVQLPIFLAFLQPSGDIETKAYAAYAQGSYRFSDQWRATAGVRFSHEKRSQDFAQTLSDPLGAVTGVPGVIQLASSEEKSWDSWTPKVGIEYIQSENVLIYGSISKGFKAGGFNSGSFQSSFDPENLLAYEIGVKTSLADDHVRLNFAGFWYDYKDIQLLTLPPSAPTGTFPIVVNAAKATVRGVEMELQAQPVESFNIDLGVAYLDAKFDEFVSVDPNNPTGNTNRKGQRMPQAPEVSSNLGAQYTWRFASAGKLALRGEWRYQSSVFFNSFADPVVKQDAYSLFNARLSFASANERWYVAAFGRNLSDELYAQTKVRQDPLVGNLNSWGAPRTYGVEVGAKF